MSKEIEQHLAVQLYTLRQRMAEDVRGTLEAVAEMGWPAVEVAGFQYDPPELAAMLKDLGLKTSGIHIRYERFVNDLDGIVRECEALGTREPICPALPMDVRNPAGFQEARETLRKAQAALAPHGLRVGYHNHDFEFETQIDGVDGLTYMLQPGPGPSVTAEFDVYWLAHGGQDPVQFMTPYKGAVSALHLKDMTRDERRTFAEVGTGSLDFPAILATGQALGVTWYVVEQDQCPGDPLDSLRISRKNLLEMLSRMA
jgi:sugar phosphate isomerase/epimerase